MTWETAFTIEQAIQDIMSRQAHYGVYFDLPKASSLILDWTAKMSVLNNKIQGLFSMDLEVPYPTPILRPFLKSGKYSKNVETWYDDIKERSTVGGPFTRVRWVKLDLQKRQRVIKQLLRMGWKPSFRTSKGNPQISREGVVCPLLRSIDGGVGEYLTEWYITSHRKSQVWGWLDGLRDDQRLSASAIVNGTNTGRMTHRLVVNVPKASDNVLYGKEMRSLFTVPDNKILMGVDAKGLELRMLCHYMNDPSYTYTLLNKDIHSYNQDLAGLPSRDAAKTFIYALIYGAGATKLGSIIGGTSKDGTRMKKKFLKGLPALQSLIRAAGTASKRGYLIALDGRRVYMRKNPNGEYQEHKALNTLLQSGGSIVMKMAAVLFDMKVKKHGLDCHQVLNMHDEFQCEVRAKSSTQVSIVKQHMLDSIKEAGEYFNLSIPLEGDVKVGKTWADTH